MLGIPYCITLFIRFSFKLFSKENIRGHGSDLVLTKISLKEISLLISILIALSEDPTLNCPSSF